MYNRKIDSMLGISNRKGLTQEIILQVFENGKKTQIGMYINSETRNCERQLLPEGLGEHEGRCVSTRALTHRGKAPPLGAIIRKQCENKKKESLGEGEGESEKES